MNRHVRRIVAWLLNRYADARLREHRRHVQYHRHIHEMNKKGSPNDPDRH